ncbi:MULTISPECIES: 50S ribosomal protein L29 [Oscillatoriophycideae]|uniref:Large ribosomal subunit protein uL29 n=1 Tax=Aerosakkonema funiforme FACHB-1375 TaxID=2949571 RepID=A0A926VA24_9CYAN|nr:MULTISPECIES: 50S ribosomal protein L29 [Oscillatoriales]MBD2179568.1 50S ribosomal protein L29 [Aerosakkonema funiforme FACHB-1375]MBD3560712.1 50S ribosomal protein L29 [Planktothrix sp. FACHB-1355]
MSLPKIEEARKLSDEELAEQIIQAKRQLFQLRLQKATRQLEKPHQFKHTKHKIAQLLTVEHERKMAAQKSASTTGSVAQ